MFGTLWFVLVLGRVGPQGPQGLAARRRKKKGLGKDMGSGSWYTAPRAGRWEGRERGKGGRGNR